MVGLIQSLFNIYILLLLARVVVSWVQPNPYHPAIRFLYDVTEPVLAPIRRLLPRTPGIDFSPVVAFLVIEIVKQVVVGLLRAVF